MQMKTVSKDVDGCPGDFKPWCCQGCSPVSNDDGEIPRKVLPVLLGIVEYEEQKAGGWFYTFLEFIFPSVLRKVSVRQT